MLINRERTAKYLQELGVEAAILSGGPNFNYAAGWGSDAHLWGGGPFAIVPSDEADEITLIIANHELPFVWRDPDFKPALRTVGREVEPVPPTSDYKPLPAEERYLAAFRGGPQEELRRPHGGVGRHDLRLGPHQCLRGLRRRACGAAARTHGRLHGQLRGRDADLPPHPLGEVGARDRDHPQGERGEPPRPSRTW